MKLFFVLLSVVLTWGASKKKKTFSVYCPFDVSAIVLNNFLNLAFISIQICVSDVAAKNEENALPLDVPLFSVGS